MNLNFKDDKYLVTIKVVTPEKILVFHEVFDDFCMDIEEWLINNKLEKYPVTWSHGRLKKYDR